MEDIRYKVIGKSINGIKIVGFIIENSDGKHKEVSKPDTVKLARSDKLSNARALLDTTSGEYIIQIKGGLGSLEDYRKNTGTRLDILGRLVTEDNKCIGYKVKDTNGKLYKLSIKKVWSLAEQGLIDGIQAKIYGDNKVILSKDDFRIEVLPKMKG